MSPLVSFVVPCYKLAHLLPDCVNSILAQSYRDFEILIMDNCSPDNTPEVARSFHDQRVKHVRNETNIGHVRNFNKGITMARGKYVWLVSADDFLTSRRALGRYVDLMERNPRVGYVFCRGAVARGPAEAVEVPSWSDCGKEDRIWKCPTFVKRLVRLNCIVMSSVMARKECYEQAALFPLDLLYAGDWYMWSVLALHHDVAYLAEPMVCWRIHDESLTTSFEHGGDPVCVRDELDVLGRVARQAGLAGMRSLRRAYNASIAGRAVRALTSSPAADLTRPGLSESELDKIILRNVRATKDEDDVRARLAVALGDVHFWNFECTKATHLYRLAIRLRPWWPKSWAKYLLLRAGSAGARIRRMLTLVVSVAGLKGYPGRSPSTR